MCQKVDKQKIEIMSLEVKVSKLKTEKIQTKNEIHIASKKQVCQMQSDHLKKT